MPPFYEAHKAYRDSGGSMKALITLGDIGRLPLSR